MRAMRLLALAAAVVSAAAVLEQLPTAHGAHMAATTTCPLYVQSRVSSTLTNPIKEVVKKTTGKKKSDSSSDSSSDNDPTVGSKDKTPSAATNNSTRGSGDGAGDAGTGSTTPKPTTEAPSGSTTTPTPTTKAPAGSTTTLTPTTDAPAATTAVPKSTDGSGGGGGTTAGRTPTSTTKAPTTRQLQADDAGDTTPAPSPTTKAPTDATATTPAPTPTTKAPSGSTSKTPTPTATNTSANTSDNSTSPSDANALTNSSSSSNSSSLTAVDSFTCDETFYNQWTTLGITCGSKQLDVAAAVAASSCMIYSGAVGIITGSTCVSICSFPACTNNAWVYDGSTNGLASAVYSSYALDAFMPAAMKARLTERSSTSSAFLSNATMAATQQCAYSSEGSFASCACSALLVNATSDDDKNRERAAEQAQGLIPKDDTTLAGNVLGPTSKSIAGVTVVMSTIAAVAGSVVSGAGAAGASAAAVGANVAVVTVEICQFAVFLNQLDLKGKSAALALFGKQMAPSAFTFLPFGKLANGSDLDNNSDDSNTRRRQLQAAAYGEYLPSYYQHRRLADNSGDITAPDSGIAKYSRTLGIKEDMLFLVTLAGVIVVMGGVLALFVLAYAAAGLFMDRSEFMVKFFDKMIGLQLLIVILSQYTIGVTGTYQIYHSVEQGNATEPKCILAAVSLLVLAIGIILYGFYVVRKHEEDLKDVGTVAHMKKAVNMRYGPLYDEYKFKNRFFFAPKMLLALVTGCATGYVGTKATYQVSVILACHVLFFFYLEIKSPHHSRFVQTTTSFVTIMKIAVLVLTFFLISASAADGFPSELQNGISLAIVGLNLFVLFLLMIRSLYTFWKKYQLQRDAKFDEDDERTAQDYFKDETPQQKDRAVAGQDAARPSAGRQPTPQTYQQTSQQQRSPYINHPTTAYGASGDDEKFSDEIRLRSGTHMQESARSSYDSRPYDENRRTATNHYMADERAGHGQRRNDVIEL